MAQREGITLTEGLPATLDVPQTGDTYLFPRDVDIHGSLTVNDGSQAVGRVLTSDANGLASWQAIPISLMSFLGNWNASTNTPALVDGTGDQGDVYRVSVAGSQDLGSGLISFDIGDWVYYTGAVWEKGDNTDQVSSVFGRTGAVVAATNDYTWAQIDKTTSSLVDITTRSHADLQNLGADDHTQYHNDARGDARYSLLAHNHAGVYEPVFSKNTGFNKNLGTSAGTVSEGNHTHSGVYEPANANIQSHISSTANPHSVTKSQVGLGNVENTKNNVSAVTYPGSNNDNTQGYSKGSIWIYTTYNLAWICTDASTGAAKWLDITWGADYSVTLGFGESSTTSTSWQTKVSKVIPSNLAGSLYVIRAHYLWRNSTTQYDFRARMSLDDTLLWTEHRAEAQDSGTNQRRTGILTMSQASSSITGKTLKLEYCSGNSANTAYIENAIVEFWRVG